jgi:hypothetical protein
MNDDVRKYIYGALTVFLVGVLVWVGFIFVNACGFTLTCNQGELPVERTPIPTLLPATLPAVEMNVDEEAVSENVVCRVAAVDLIGAWAAAGSPETEAFQFTDSTGQNCEATFEAVKPLFVEANLWYPGSLSCVSCHSVDLTVSPAQLDLSSYAGIIAGSRRAEAESNGTDIFGAGNWESSLLYEFLSESKADVPGHTESLSGLMIFAGTPLPEPEATPTP